MKKITYDQLKDLITNAKPNERIDMSMYSNFKYKWFRIDVDIENEKREYTWALEYDYNKSSMVGYVYPLRNSNYIKFFKTENGAKRSLIKYFEFSFRDEVEED